MKVSRMLAGAAALATVGWAAVPSAFSEPTRAQIPHYQHIIEIMMENTSYGTIIGNSLAPNINALADKYGLATDYFGVTHASEPNYVASIGGDYFGIQDDNQFYCTPSMAGTDPTCAGTTVDHTVSAPNLAQQLTDAGMSWKGYFQNLPYVAPGSVVSSGPNANGPYTFKWPSNSNALYASKHNPFINFTSTQGDLSQMVSDGQLGTDLLTGNLANYSLIVPDQCHDMHGTGGCNNTSNLIAAGDQYVGNAVSQVMASPVWREGNNAIVVTWDEDDFADQGQTGTGCCGADPGGGHVATIVITNHGEQHITDSTPANHYSLLRTMEQAFGLPCLAHACDAAVQPLSELFAN